MSARALSIIAACAAAAGCGRVSFDTVDATSDAPEGVALIQHAVDASLSAITLSVTLPDAPRSGSLLVMVGASTIQAIASITGGSTAWVRAAKSAMNPNIEIWYGPADGSSTVTITGISAANMTLALSEWTGLVMPDPLDIATAKDGATSPASAGPIALGHAPDLVIFGVADFLPTVLGTPTAGPWTELDSITRNSIQTVWYRTTTATGPFEPTVDETAHRWDAAIAAFRIAP